MATVRKQYSPSPSPRRNMGRVGASPIASRTKREWNWGFLRVLFKLVVLAAVLTALAFGVQQLNPREWLDQFMNRPIAGVSVESEFNFISQADTQALVAARLSKTFMELDMLGIKNALEANPWIDKVMISRGWPDKLVVHIEEQKPIARWSSIGFLNMRGDVVKVDNPQLLAGLPIFVADEQYAKEVMQQYLLVKNIMAPSNLVPQLLELDNTLAWRIQFNTGLGIKLGREKSLEKLQNISKILRSDLAHEVNRIQNIDMRYENGFAVAWKDDLAPQMVARPSVKNQNQNQNQIQNQNQTDTSQLSAE